MSRSIKTILVLLLGCAVFLLGTFTHEGGHAIVAAAFGQPIHSIAIIPGIQVYPTVRCIHWNGAIAWVDADLPTGRWEHGFFLVMGCGLTAFFAYLWLLVAAFSRRSLKAILLGASVGYAWDMFLYATMPLLGLRHWIIIGGDRAEPLVGARLMGLPDWVFWSFLSIHFVIFHWFFIQVSRRKQINQPSPRR